MELELERSVGPLARTCDITLFFFKIPVSYIEEGFQILHLIMNSFRVTWDARENMLRSENSNMKEPLGDHTFQE